VGDFERVLGAPALLVGFALPGCNMHAPNEWFTVDNFETGIDALISLYPRLGSALRS
jgi:acetylornithine deacetylase/succinyl-diaminopimelate desuccinylase-like protein